MSLVVHQSAPDSEYCVVKVEIVVDEGVLPVEEGGVHHPVTAADNNIARGLVGFGGGECFHPAKLLCVDVGGKVVGVDGKHGHCRRPITAFPSSTKRKMKVREFFADRENADAPDRVAMAVTGLQQQAKHIN